MAGQYASLVVLEEQSDPEQDIYAEPRLLCAIGNVPDEMVAALAPDRRPTASTNSETGAVHIAAISFNSPVPLPLLVHAVRAGFPSPADDFIEEGIDLSACSSPTALRPSWCGSPATAWSARASSTVTLRSSTAR